MARLSYRFGLPVAAAAMLVGCATTPPETPAEALARRSVDCLQVGFTRDTPEFRLCLLLQETNERLDVMERRLRFIEQDTRFGGPYYPRGWWW